MSTKDDAGFYAGPLLSGRAMLILLSILAFALARHLWLAAYVHPFADDFSYAMAGMQTSLVDRLAQEYSSWNGRYFSNILLLRGPLLAGLPEGLLLYRLSAVGLIVLTVLACIRFVKALFVEPIGWRSSVAIALLFLLIYLQAMPNASEGIYWYTGAMTYQLPSALSLFLLANWIGYLRGTRFPGVGWCIVQFGLVVMIVGCNEVHMALMVLFHLGLLVWRYRRTNRWDPLIRSVLLVVLACAAVMMLAPGNATRGAHFPMRHEPLHTLGYSVAQTFRFIGTWLLSGSFVLWTIVLVLAGNWAAARGVAFAVPIKMNPWWALALPFALVFLVMVVTYWPTGLLGQHRTANVALFYCIPTWSYAVLVWNERVFRPRGWFQDEPWIAFQWIFVVWCAVNFNISKRDMQVNDDLFAGGAKQFDMAMHERYELISAAIKAGASEVILPPVVPPTSLEVLPLDTVPHHWMNTSMADYFGDPRLKLIAPRAPISSQE